MVDKKSPDEQEIQPGMIVETTEGDLGEDDVSKPKVTGVVQDQNGDVEKVVVTKGVFFKKKVNIPAERVQNVEQRPASEADQGKVKVDARQAEIADLKATGEESLANEITDNLLDQIEQELPTAEGLRELEYNRANVQEKRAATASAAEQAAEKQPGKINFLLNVLGPGFLSGMAGNDSSAVTAYAVNGAINGYSQLWLMLLSTPLYQAIQYSCAKIGRLTQMGLAEILRTHYARWVAILASAILIIANVALISADLVAIGSGLSLITGLAWYWFVVPIALILWYLTVYRTFETIKKIFIVMSLAFVSYVITAIFSGANWQAVLLHTFIPQISFSFAGISSALALLGATFSPYSMFWQAESEKEEQRPGPTKKQLRLAALDVASGVISGNFVSYFIIICTSATLFTHHQSINTAADAARALEPLLGPFAQYLFAIGLIGAGLIAIPILLASTSYAVAGTFGWPSGLSKKPWQNEGFYLILTMALVVSLVIALLRFNPIQLIFWSNVLSGILAPVLVIYILIIGNNRKIMRSQPLGMLTNIGLVIAALILITAIGLLFYGLITGQGR